MTHETTLHSSAMTTNTQAVTLSNLFKMLAPYRKTLPAIGLASTVLGYAFSFTLPVIYTAKATFVPPQSQQSSMASLLNQLPAIGGGSSLLSKDSSQYYLGLLNTSTVARNIIRQFNLQAYYNTKTLTATQATLNSRVIFQSAKNSLITVEVEDTSPAQAAAIANAYPEALNQLLQSMSTSEATQRRKFFETQLQLSKQQLIKAEINFKELQESSGVLRLEDQGHAAIENLSKLRAQIAIKEVELNALKTGATEANSQVKRLQAELQALNAQLSQVEKSKDSAPTNLLNIAIDKLPSKGMEYLRRYRELKFQETMHEILIKQFETAHMDEAREFRIVQLVDPALPPEIRSKPRRASIAVSVGITAMFATLIYIFLRRRRS